MHGLVTTYQQLAMGPAAKKLAGLSAGAFVILDEIHHAGHDKAWGEGVRKSFGHAHKRLSLSGTPFRSDAAPIPFVRYDNTAEGELAHADYTYGYADALRDGGVVRPVYFPRVDGEMEWTSASGDTAVNPPTGSWIDGRGSWIAGREWLSKRAPSDPARDSRSPSFTPARLLSHTGRW